MKFRNWRIKLFLISVFTVGSFYPAFAEGPLIAQVEVEAPVESSDQSQFVLSTDVLTSPDAQPLANQAAIDVSQGERASAPLSLEDNWSAFRHHFGNRDITVAWEHLLAFVEGCHSSGFNCQESYALTLLELAAEELEAGRYVTAKSLTEQSLFLSRRSPQVLLAGAILIQRFSLGSLSDQAVELLAAIASSPRVALSLGARIVYPVLWAVVFAFYLTFLLVISFRGEVVLTQISKYLSGPMKGLGSLVILLVLMIPPVVFGPLWSIALYSLIGLFIMPGFKRLAFVGGVIVCLWGCLIPIVDNLNNWLKSELGQVMLRSAEGYLVREDLDKLERLVELFPQEVLPKFYTALGYRLSGRLNSAQQLLGSIKDSERSGWLQTEQGVLSILRDDLVAAESHFKRAEELGMRSPAFLFNYSKLKWAQLDMAQSNVLLRQAQRRGAEEVVTLQELEEQFGNNSESSFGKVLPSPWRVLPLVVFKKIASSDGGVKIASSVMRGLDPMQITFLGALLILLTLFKPASVAQKKTATLFAPFKKPILVCGLARLLPGGVSIREGAPFKGWVILTIIAVLLAPLILFLAHFPQADPRLSHISPYYTGFLLLVILVAWWADNASQTEDGS